MGTQDILLALRGLSDDDLRAIRTAVSAILRERSPAPEIDHPSGEDERRAHAADDASARDQRQRADEEARRSAEREALRCQECRPRNVPAEAVLDFDDEE